MKARYLAAGALSVAVAVLFVWPDAPAGPTGQWLARAGLEPQFDAVAGQRLRYVRSGHGPAIVLVHGFGSSLYSWRDVIGPLSRSHDVVALDLPGFGQSGLPPDLSADLYPPVVLGLMDHLGLARASLVGHSMGGAVATVIASRFPERVHRLVLLDAAGFDLTPGERPWLLRLVGSDAGGVLARLPRRRLLVTLGLRQVFFDRDHVTAERIDEYLAPLERPGATEALRSLLGPGGFGAFSSFGEIAARVKAPTLIVWGREDAWIPLSDADRFQAALPSARKVVLEKCGHVPQEELPGAVTQLLEEFLTEPTSGT
ncbi:MAG: alpha/beta fold hydrolase [Vicinamibacteria bacterium]